jgi:hypothetical protein
MKNRRRSEPERREEAGGSPAINHNKKVMVNEHFFVDIIQHNLCVNKRLSLLYCCSPFDL